MDLSENCGCGKNCQIWLQYKGSKLTKTCAETIRKYEVLYGPIKLAKIITTKP